MNEREQRENEQQQEREEEREERQERAVPRVGDPLPEVDTGGGEKQRTGLTPRIYVASLSDYNSGVLHGEWIDADQEPEAIDEEIQAMLAASPTARQEGLVAEEYAIHDYEGFGSLRIDEYESIQRVARLAEGLAENGLPFGYWAARCDQEVDSEQWAAELDRFSEAYLGVWESEADYAAQLLEDMGVEEELDRAVPQGLRPYVTVDYESLAVELFADLWSVRDGTGVHVFDAR